MKSLQDMVNSGEKKSKTLHTSTEETSINLVDHITKKIGGHRMKKSFKEDFKGNFWTEGFTEGIPTTSHSSRLNNVFVNMNEQVTNIYDKTILDFKEFLPEEDDDEDEQVHSDTEEPMF